MTEMLLRMLMLGGLAGGAAAMIRVSGVDFRQYLKDPGEPAEVEDDSWVGAVRATSAHLALWVLATLAVLWLVARWRRSDWLPHDVEAIGWAILRVGTLAAGWGAGQALAEAAWRLGLRIAPDPVPSARFLAERPTPGIAGDEPRAPDGDGGMPAVGRGAPRRLVLFCDGTWNWPDAKRETNVVRLLRAVQTVGAEHVRQSVFYHQGVGTGNFVDRIVGGGAGVGIANSVKACYGFLADNYQLGDEILIFGFSRGAYVARSVAGLVVRLGIFEKAGMADFAEAWDVYTDRKSEARTTRLEALKTHTQPAVIRCVGVWDTVGALGIPGTRFCARSFTFHETELGPGIQYAFQALALDERRGNFQASVWVPPHPPVPGQVLEQVWFPGVHSNVGGGYIEHGLSDATLLWMASRLMAYGLLDLDETCLGAFLDPNDVYPNAKLADSRGIWSLIGSPVPRPAGRTSSTEGIHESAWLRVPSGRSDDPYRRTARAEWLQAMVSQRVAASPFETSHRLPSGPLRPNRPYRSRKLGFCDHVMSTLGGSG